MICDFILSFFRSLLIGVPLILIYTQIRIWREARRKAKRAAFDKVLFEGYQKRNFPALWAMNHPGD